MSFSGLRRSSMATNKEFGKTRSNNPPASTSSGQQGEPIYDGNMTVLKKVLGVKDVTCCDAQDSHRIIAIGLSDGMIELRDSTKFRLLATLDPELNEEPKLPATDVSFHSAQPLLLASYASGFTCLWNHRNKVIEWSILENRQPLVNTFSLDCSSFAIAGTDNKITLYDTTMGILMGTFESSEDMDLMDGHTMRIFALKFHPSNPKEFVTGGWDNTVQVWSTERPQSVRRIYGPHICGDGIDFASDGNTLITAAWCHSNALQMWDYNTCKLIEDITPSRHQSMLYCCRYYHNGNFVLAGGGSENIFFTLDIETKIMTSSYRRLPHAVYFIKDIPKPPDRTIFERFCVGFGSDVWFMEYFH